MSRSSDAEQAAYAARRTAMAVLARAPGNELRRLWAKAELSAEAEMVRGPETGLVTVRGRTGGGGAEFNLGEATVTRATARLSTGEVGHAYALGRDAEKARICATIDALRQKAGMADRIDAAIVAPLIAALAKADEKRRAETAATKVDFFTMVRGED